MSLHRAARKIGLGFRPNENPTVSVSDWIDQQLGQPAAWRGLGKNKGEDSVAVEWPAELTYSLDQRVDMMKEHRRQEEELWARKVDNVTLRRESNELNKAYLVHYQDIHRFAHSASYGGDQVKQRLMHFWLNHFTVGRQSTSMQWIGHYYAEAIYGALDGTFNDMMFGVSSHPAMLVYLDNIFSIGENSPKAKECRGSECVVGLNDNLGREIMELHSVTPAREYTEQDIHNAAKILSGWGDNFARPLNYSVKSYWDVWVPYHAEPGTKTVLGKTYPEGKEALPQFVEDLASDSSTIDFLSRKLAMHFIGENASEEEISAIREVWTRTGGHLPDVHRTVLKLAVQSEVKRYHWPLTWLFQAIRVTDAHLFNGYEQMWEPSMETAERDPWHIFEELGNSFWAIRQPNGFSEAKKDWVSTEHFDRRIRMADLIARTGAVQLTAEDIIDQQGLSSETRAFVSKAGTEADRIVLLLCSPELMEV